VKKYKKIFSVTEVTEYGGLTEGSESIA